MEILRVFHTILKMNGGYIMVKKGLKRTIMLLLITMCFTFSVVLLPNIANAESILNVTQLMDNLDIKESVENFLDTLEIKKYLEMVPQEIENALNPAEFEKYLEELPKDWANLLNTPEMKESLNDVLEDIITLAKTSEVKKLLQDVGDFLDTPEIHILIKDFVMHITDELNTSEISDYLERLSDSVEFDMPEMYEYEQKLFDEIDRIMSSEEMEKYLEELQEKLEKISEKQEMQVYLLNILIDMENVEKLPVVEKLVEDLTKYYIKLMETPEVEKYLDELMDNMDDERYENIDEYIEEIEKNPDSLEELENLQEFIIGIENRSSSWAQEGLVDACRNSLIPDDMLQDNLTQNITRQEFVNIAVTLYEVLTGEEINLPSTNPFIDTDDVQVLKAYNLGIISGMSLNTFAPNNTITREQVATIMTNLLSKVGIDVSVDRSNVVIFEDDNQISDWAKNSVYFMANQGIIKGVSSTQNIFDAKSQTTKEQAILISNLILQNVKFM